MTTKKFNPNPTLDPTKKPPVVGFICGLGGREVTVPDVQKMAEAVYNAADGKKQPLTQWIGLRE